MTSELTPALSRLSAARGSSAIAGGAQNGNRVGGFRPANRGGHQTDDEELASTLDSHGDAIAEEILAVSFSAKGDRGDDTLADLDLNYELRRRLDVTPRPALAGGLRQAADRPRAPRRCWRPGPEGGGPGLAGAPWVAGGNSVGRQAAFRAVGSGLPKPVDPVVETGRGVASAGSPAPGCAAPGLAVTGGAGSSTCCGAPRAAAPEPAQTAWGAIKAHCRTAVAHLVARGRRHREPSAGPAGTLWVGWQSVARLVAGWVQPSRVLSWRPPDRSVVATRRRRRIGRSNVGTGRPVMSITDRSACPVGPPSPIAFVRGRNGDRRSGDSAVTRVGDRADVVAAGSRPSCPLDAEFDLVKEGVNLFDVVAEAHSGGAEYHRAHIGGRQRTPAARWRP